MLRGAGVKFVFYSYVYLLFILGIAGPISRMDSLKRIASRQFNDLTQKRQSTQLKSCPDDFASSFDEPVHPNEQRMELAANPRPIKKVLTQRFN